MKPDGNNIDEALRREFNDRSRELGDHPSPTDLDAYRDGALDPERTRSVREHLVLCRECTDLLLWLDDPSRFGAEDRLEVPHQDLDAAWESLAPSLGEPLPPSQRLEPTAPRRWRSIVWQPVWAAAVLATVGLGLWGLRLSTENRDLRSRIADSDRATPSALGINRPVISLSPPRSVRDVDAQPTVTTIPEGRDVYVFILNFREERAYPDYKVAILDPAGRNLWSGSGLIKTERGNVTLTVPRDLLPADRFRVELHGLEGESQQELATYEVVFEDGGGG